MRQLPLRVFARGNLMAYALFQRFGEVPQVLFRLPSFGDIAGHAEPLDDHVVVVQNGNGAGERPAQRSVRAANLVLQLKWTLGSHCVVDCRHHTQAIGGRNVRLQPGVVGTFRGGDEIPPHQVVHHTGPERIAVRPHAAKRSRQTGA